MTILTFSISDLQTGRGLGLALICPEARYASIAWRGAERLDRRFVQPADWRLLVGALGVGLPSGPLPADHPVVRMLLDQPQRPSIVVQYVAQRPIDVTPATAAQDLDAELRRQADSSSAP